MIEDKLGRLGDAKVDLSDAKRDYEDTRVGLEGDQEVMITVKKDCNDRKASHEEAHKTRANELTALAETIKVLNDDDAQALFRKTVAGAPATFLQVRSKSRQASKQVPLSEENTVEALKRLAEGDSAHHQLRLIATAARGAARNRKGFEKVVTMLDNMVALLGQEQGDDDA